MISTDKIIVVEGKYDRHTLANFIDATIIETGGFGIFKDKALSAYLRRIAAERGLIVLTDSDRAGFAIRNYIGQLVGKQNVTDVYIPDLYGKERRKKKPSKEGLLGVEGMTEKIIEDAFLRAGVTVCARPVKKYLKKSDLYAVGLSGGTNSAAMRQAVKKYLDLPQNLSTNRLLDILNIMLDRAQFEKMLDDIKEEN